MSAQLQIATPQQELISTVQQEDDSTSSNNTSSSYFQYYNSYAREMGILSYLLMQGLVYPMERMKVLHQVDILPEILDDHGSYSLKENIDAYTQRHQESDSFESYYRGFGTKLVKFLTKELTVYAISDKIRQEVNVFDQNKSPFNFFLHNALSGVLAGGIAEMITYPLEMAKTRIICDGGNMDNRVYTSIYDSLFKEGFSFSSVRQLFHGALFSLIGASFYRGLQIGLYETSVELFNLREKCSLWQVPIAVFSTVFAQKAAFPIDTVRRQLMLHNTQFEVTSAKLHTIISRLSHPRRQKDLLRGWNVQFYKSITSGLFLFGYKAIEESINFAPDLYNKFTA